MYLMLYTTDPSEYTCMSLLGMVTLCMSAFSLPMYRGTVDIKASTDLIIKSTETNISCLYA